MASKPNLPRSAYIPWAYFMLIGGLLFAFVAWATLSLPPQGSFLAITKMGVGLGIGLSVLGGIAILGQRRGALRGLDPNRGRWQGYAIFGIAALLLLALALALWPMPSGRNWLGTVLTLLSVGGALGIGAVSAVSGTPLVFRQAQQAYEQGEDGKALALLKALELERPGFFGTQHLFSLIYRERGEAAAAIHACQRLISLRPNLYFGHSELGLNLLDQDEPEKALASLRRAAELAPNLAEAHFNLGMGTASVADHEATIDALSRSLRLGLRDEPAEVMARYRLYQAFRALGHTARARTELRRLRRQQRVIGRWRNELSEGRYRQGGGRSEGRLLSAIERLLDQPTSED